MRLLTSAEVASDADHKYLSVAELEAGWRLSCRSAVQADCVAEVPRLMTSPKAALLGYGQHVLLDIDRTISMRQRRLGEAHEYR